MYQRLTVGYAEYESKGQYIDGKKHGKWLDVAVNGKIYKEYYYDNGNPIGTWKFFNPDGAMRLEFEVKDALVKRFKIYNGNLGSIEAVNDSSFSENQTDALMKYEGAMYEFRLFNMMLEAKTNSTVTYIG